MREKNLIFNIFHISIYNFSHVVHDRYLSVVYADPLNRLCESFIGLSRDLRLVNCYTDLHREFFDSQNFDVVSRKYPKIDFSDQIFQIDQFLENNY